MAAGSKLFLSALLCFLFWGQSAKIDICDLARPACRRGESLCLQRFGNALPPELFDGIQTNLTAQGSAHGWVLRKSSAKNDFEEAAFMLADLLGLSAGDWESVEYWSHDWSRYEAAPWSRENFHFDILEPSMCYAHPAVSSVLYLDGMGPPTVVLSKSLSDMPFTSAQSGPNDSSVFLSWPEPNHWLAFSGDLAHGVLWREHEQLSSSKPPHAMRRVVLFAFWRHALIPPETLKRKIRKADAPPLGIFGKMHEEPSSQQRHHTSSAEEVLAYRVPADAADQDVVVGIEDPMDIIKLEISFRVVGNGSSWEGCMLDQTTWKRLCSPEFASGPLLEIPGSIRNVNIEQPSGFQGGIFEQSKDAMFGPGLYTIAKRTVVGLRADLQATEENKLAELLTGASIRVIEVVFVPSMKAVRARIEQPNGWISLVDITDGSQWAIRQEVHLASGAHDAEL